MYHSLEHLFVCIDIGAATNLGYFNAAAFSTSRMLSQLAVMASVYLRAEASLSSVLLII